MAGVVGNFVHGNQWSQYNMITGEYTFINPYLQRQFQLEGYFAATLLIFSSFCFIFMIHYIPRMKNSWTRRFTFLLVLLIMISTLNTWMFIYCKKNPSYPFHYYFDWFELIQWFKATVYEYTRVRRF